MTPTKSFRIWFTPRTGSTLLAKSLEETGVAGKAGEFFTLFEYTSLLEKFSVSNYDQLKVKLWQEGSSDNGIFGIKMVHDPKVINELRTLREVHKQPTLSDHQLYLDLFPDCKDIYLMRRNKVRQAVSWWKAIKDNVWHLKSNDPRPSNSDRFYEDNYDFDALSHLFKEASLRDCAIEAYFTQFGITPLTIVYEDMILDFENTIRRVIDFLNLEAGELQIKDKFYQKTADKESEQWVERFMADLQK